MEKQNDIYFYGSKGHYGYMSNFYKCSFKATIDVPENNPYYNVEIELFYLADRCPGLAEQIP